MAKSGLQSINVGGVTKRSYWKYEADMDRWIEYKNLPVTFENAYLQRGFRKSPPEETKQETVESQKKGRNDNRVL